VPGAGLNQLLDFSAPIDSACVNYTCRKMEKKSESHDTVSHKCLLLI